MKREFLGIPWEGPLYRALGQPVVQPVLRRLPSARRTNPEQVFFRVWSKTAVSLPINSRVMAKRP